MAGQTTPGPPPVRRRANGSPPGSGREMGIPKDTACYTTLKSKIVNQQNYIFL